MSLFPNSAGRSAQRQYRKLSGQWRRRVFGRRVSALVWAALLLLWIVLFELALPSRWALVTGVLLGALTAFWIVLPDALMPAWIRNWQVGSWGEQNTASELRRLPTGWVRRNDRASPNGGNRDHVVAGPAVYVLDTKNLSDSEVTIEGSGLRVSHLEGSDGYLLDRFPVRRHAKQLEQEARENLASRWPSIQWLSSGRGSKPSQLGWAISPLCAAIRSSSG